MSDASGGNRASLSGAGWRAAVLDERASGHAFCILNVRAADLQNEMPGQRFSVPSASTKTVAAQRTSLRAIAGSQTERDAQASGTGGLGVQRTRRTTWRISPTRLHSASAVASVALRLTGFTQLPQPATFTRQPRGRGTVVGETGCRCICAHSVDICVEVGEVASPDVPARQGKGTDNSRSLLHVSGSRSDARRLRSHQ
jgi:hypothetical protein